LIASIASCVALAIAQASPVVPRDVRAHADNTASIAGVVVADDAESRPVRHARVTLRSPDANVDVTTVTGTDGQFVFTGLPSGRFSVSVSKDGWLTTAYGANRPLRAGTAVPVGSGQTARIVVRMVHGAAITGEVQDASGYPAVGATVRAMRVAIINGQRRLDVNGSLAVADDRGVYRIYGLPPGNYVIGASWRPAYFGSQGSELHLTTDLDVREALASTPSSASAPRAHRAAALASTFYPGTTVPKQAAIVSLNAAEERAGVDFTLQIVPTAHVEGTVSSPGNAALSGAVVSLMATDQVAFPGVPFDGYRTASIQDDGSFAFSDVVPGQYTLFARAQVPDATGVSRTMWSSMDVLVDGDDMSGLALALAPCLSITGQLRFAGKDLRPPADLKAVRVTLLPVQTDTTATAVPGGATVDSGGRFTFSGITPGRYTFGATMPGLGSPGGWTLGSALVNGLDALDVPFTVAPNGNIADVIVTFTDRVAQLTGALRSGDGGPAADYSIVLFPTSSSLWLQRSRRIQTVRPSADGAFAFRNVPPGEYYLAAPEDVEAGAAFDPAFLQQLVPSSMKLAIGEGEHKVQEIRIAR
jgi:hypothetical protein